MKTYLRMEVNCISSFFSKNLKYLNKIFIIGIFILFAGLLFSSCSKQNKTVISGRIENAQKIKAYLVEIDSVQDKIIDSVDIKNNGKFRFTLPIDNPGYYQFKINDSKILTLILSPGEKINLTTDFNDFYNKKSIEGSFNSSKVNFLYDSLRNTIVLLDKIRRDYAETIDSDKDTAKLNNLSKTYQKIIENYRRFSIGYIIENLKSLTNIAALFQEYSPGFYVFSEARDMQYYKLVSDTLGKYYPKVKQVRILRENYKAFYDSYQTKKMIQMAKPADNHLPDLKLPDKNGTARSLSSLRGKTVLLSFWSVINSDCIQNNSEMQKIYKKFRGKGFEIYQVSVDNLFQVWTKELTTYNIPWISVCDTAFFNSTTRGLYNVNALPLNYLLNADQTDLLGKNLSPSELDQKLSVLLKK
jgi:hypothetical protein